MAQYRIPVQYQRGFEVLLSLTESARQKLIAEINQAKVGLKTEELSEILSKKVGIDCREAEVVIYMLRSLFNAKADSESSLENFVDNIIYALRNLGDKKLQPKANTKKELQEILSSSPAFDLTVKANVLASDRERVITESTIVTDIRPILDKKNKINGTVVIHNIKFLYHQDGELKESYFALRNSELKKLKQQILELEDRENEIRKQLKLPIIDLE